MAFCRKCGKQIPDDSKFCTHCGEAVIPTEQKPTVQSEPVVEPKPSVQPEPVVEPKPTVQPTLQRAPQQTGANEQKKTNIGLIIGLCAGGLLLFFLLIVLSIVLVIGARKDKKVDEENTEYVAASTQETTEEETESTTEATTEEETTEATTEKKTTEATTEEKKDGLESQVIATDIVKSIMGQSYYYEDPYFPAQGLFMDINQDGSEELLIIYWATYSSGIPQAEYKLWTIKDGESTLVREDVLFKQVGGSSGTVGPVQCGDEYYLGVEIREPEGDRFNTYTSFIPFNNDSSLGDAWVYLEAHGIYGEEDMGDYILGDTRVDYSTYQSRYDEFRFIYELNPLQDPGNGHAMPLDRLLEFLDY